MRAALIGLGMVARTYADAFAKTRLVELKSICSRSAEREVEFLRRSPSLGVTIEKLVDICTDPEIDFVVLATPPNARRHIVDKLVTAGKPILMEKPVERTLAAAEDLVATCERACVPLGIMLQHRARPAVGDLRRLRNDLGDVVAVEINVPWWRPQSYYDEPGRGTYERDGGGVLISQAIHTLDLAICLAGQVESVFAMSKTTTLHKMEAEDFVCAGLMFQNGAVGQLFATTASFPGRGESITFHHDAGSVHLSAGVVEIHRRDGTHETFGETAQSGAGADPMAFTSDWHRFVIEDFAQSLSDGRPPLVPGREALNVHRLITALETSAQRGERIRLMES